ncbi:hypothetical protein RJ641_031398 [Dillenia turbinata]|uniref:Uncharacterized protein n=1 Tax=Dillenia turbinata TaxID=194707 RepID=A0AAN8ZKX4_9MAGN
MDVHNYICQRVAIDNGFQITQNETYLPSNTKVISLSNPYNTNMEAENEDDDWAAFRLTCLDNPKLGDT